MNPPETTRSNAAVVRDGSARERAPAARDGGTKAPAPAVPAPGERWDPAVHGDRRRKPHVYSDWRYIFGGRRRSPIILGDGLTAGVDRYPTRVLLLVIAILLLNAVDAIFTLRLLDAGVAEEWNPFMRLLLNDDVRLFVNLKIAITAGALIIIVACSQIPVFGTKLRVERVLHWVLTGYLVLIAYHVTLLLRAGL
ncbi:MAG TPA: DUF5658 family protein [Longimicrobiales bacterium]|nr:DUF5658 family protein [Longimicrobiales bacterium]